MTEELEPIDSSVNMDPLIGTHIDERYRVESLLGRGGSAAVYKAYDEKVGRLVAVKLPKNSDPFAGESKASFEREATRYIRLQHPNTLRLFDYGQTQNGQTYIVTELLSGETLKERLDRFEEEGRKGIGVRATLALLKDVASALSEAHAVGLVHRDLKPSNIFIQSLGGQEVIKVIDFGISKDLQEATLTGSSTLWGTPLYMSPEQSYGKSVDARSDLYTLGVIAFECLSGRPPFQGSTPYAILMQHIDSEPPTLAEVGFTQELPQGFESMLNRLMAKEPGKRTRSSDALIAEIEQIEDIWTSIRVTATSTNMPSVNDRRGSMGIYVGMALLLCGIGVWQLVASGDPVSETSQPKAVVAPVLKSTDDTVAIAKPDQERTSEGEAANTVKSAAAAAKPLDQGVQPQPKPEPVVKDVVLDLTSKPQGVRVHLDGKEIGSTPLMVNVPYADTNRTLKLSKRGFRATTLELPAKSLRFQRTVKLKTIQKRSPFKVKAQ